MTILEGPRGGLVTVSLEEKGDCITASMTAMSWGFLPLSGAHG